MQSVQERSSGTAAAPTERRQDARSEAASISIVRADRLERAPVVTFPPITEKPRSLEGRLIRNMLATFGNPRVQMILWTGEVISASDEPAVLRVRVADRATLLKLCADPDVQFGDAYSSGKLEIEGDLERFIEDVYDGAARIKPSATMARKWAARLSRPRFNTLTGSRENIHHHYDIGNEFYSLWLGSTMAYTCAYFPTPDAGLEVAQVAKMDHVCRKLRLKAGESVVEAGCGWGSLAIHMASHYGVKVRAFNISREQLAYARRRAQEAGIDQQVEFVEDDYRNITGHYDVFASVGMLEHVGVDNYPELGRVIDRVLTPQGRGLIHTIGRNRQRPMHRWIERRIFPGANPPSLKEMMDIFEEADFSILDVENIRLHYAKTLQYWHELFEASSDKVAAMFDEKFVRMWRLYLLGSKAAFQTGDLQLFQALFARGRNNDIPWTRADIYQR